MKVRNWLWTSRKSRGRSKARQTPRTLLFQQLEFRRVLDASAVLVDGVLQIQADDAGCDVAVVANQGTVSVISGDQEIASIPSAAIDLIMFQGGDGNDAFANNSSIPSQIWGGNGDDELRGGSAADVIHGEAGDDQLSGGAGNDQMFGGSGDDTMRGGDGDDALFGDSGQDVLLGEDGADYLDGGASQDQLDGGSGADQMLADPPETSSLLTDALVNVDADDTLTDSAAIGVVNGSEIDEGATISQITDLPLDNANTDTMELAVAETAPAN